LTAVFGGEDLPREAVAALVLFRQAVEEERVTVAMIEEVARRLRWAG